MRTTPFSPCALPTLRKPVVLWVPHHSVFRGHSLDASHQVSSSRQRKVWLTTASPQAISTCCEGVLHQAGIIRFKVAYTEPSKEAFSCQQGMKKWVETECVGSNVPRYPRLWDSPKTSRLLPGASRWSTWLWPTLASVISGNWWAQDEPTEAGSLLSRLSRCTGIQVYILWFVGERGLMGWKKNGRGKRGEGEASCTFLYNFV